MGCEKMTVYDFDTIEQHNYPNQLLPEQMQGKKTVGIPKVQALQALIYSMTDLVIDAKEERYVDQPLSGIVIAATDSMSSRMDIFAKCKNNPEVELFIDARMSALKFMIFTVNPFSTDVWEKSVFPDSEAEELPCTAKSIIYNTFGIAAEIGNIIKCYCNREQYPAFIEKNYQTYTQSVGGLHGSY